LEAEASTPAAEVAASTAVPRPPIKQGAANLPSQRDTEGEPEPGPIVERQAQRSEPEAG
jgi:hypothetical protein